MTDGTDLLQAHLSLAVFKFAANLKGLVLAVAKRNAKRKPCAFVGRGGVYEFIQRGPIAGRWK